MLLFKNTVGNVGYYLIIPILSCLWLAISALKKEQLKTINLCIQSLCVSLLFVLMGALSIIYYEIRKYSYTEVYTSPNDLAFYGVQVLGVLGALLTTYVRTLPKA